MTGVAIELFSCSGGMAEGFRRAGISFDWVFDRDPNAVESYTANLGHRPIQIDAVDLVRMVRGGWRLGPVGLLVADPPCTPWSRAGKRLGTADERDMLEETCTLIAILRPAAYLIGNVPGLQDATSWGAVQEHIGGLARHGYCVADYAQLDAANYGVPQHRIRPFWYGHRSGPCIRWPEPTHGDTAAQPSLVSRLAPWVTVRQALGHLPADEIGRPVRVKRHRDHGLSDADAPSKTVTRNSHGDGALVQSRPWHNPHPPTESDAPARTLTTVERSGHGGGAGVLLTNRKHPINRPDRPSHTVTARDGGGAQGAPSCEWPWDRPATAVTCDERLPPPEHHPESGSIMSQPNAIVLGERARKLLQGFPESWNFAGDTKASRNSQLGQAMPPPLAHAVAESVRRQLESAPLRLTAGPNAVLHYCHCALCKHDWTAAVVADCPRCGGLSKVRSG